MSINSPQPPTTPPLRLIHSANTDTEQVRVLEVIRTAISSARRDLTRTVHTAYRSSFVTQAVRWAGQARGWLLPVRTIVTGSGLALPVWAVTHPTVQHVTLTVFRRIGGLTRRVLRAAVRLAQHGLSLTGEWGQHQSARLVNTVDRAERASTRLGHRASRCARAGSATRPHVRVLHETALVVVIARQFRVLVPAEWRLVVTGLSLLTVGPQTRTWITAAVGVLRALMRDLAGLFTPPPAAPATATATGPTVPFRPVPRARPGQRRRHR